MVIEQRLAFGRQLVILLTPKGRELAESLRAADYPPTEVKGHARDGDLTILCVEIPRREAQKVIHLACAVDERCVFSVHDIRLADFVEQAAPKASQRKHSWLFHLGGAFLKRGIS
jgi:uncharacterized protein YebE (UPF0316 family)